MPLTPNTLLTLYTQPKAGQLRCLNVSNNRLGDRAVAILCKGLVSCPTLNQLQLRGNEVASAAMASLTHALVEQEKKSFIRDDITLGIQVLPCSGLMSCTVALHAAVW